MKQQMNKSRKIRGRAGQEADRPNGISFLEHHKDSLYGKQGPICIPKGNSH